MKKTLRTMMLAGAGLLGSVAVAQAQPAAPPTAPPAPPPAGDPAAPPAPPAPPPADFGVAPAALPPAPVTSSTPLPTVSFGNTPPGDTTTPAVEEKPQSPFYFTRLMWGNAASAKIFGIGKDYISTDDAAYNMDFTLNFRYYFLNQPLDKAYVNVRAGVTVELTNSDTTTTKHEPQLIDTSVSVGYGHTVYKSADKQFSTTPGVSVGVVLPTSKLSYDTGTYFGTSVAANIIQLFPLAGAKSDWFTNVLAFGTVGYTHTFAKCYENCNSSVSDSHPRQTGVLGAQDNADNPVGPSDILSGSSKVMDKVRFNLTYFLTLYKDLSLANTWEIALPIKHQFPTSTVTTPTGPVTVSPSTTVVNPTTTFDVSLSYEFFNMARVDLGYQNITPELQDNSGQRRSVFYSTEAVFYGNVSVYLDGIYDRVTNPPDKKAKLADGRFHPLRF